MKRIFGNAEFLKRLVLIALPIGLQSVINLLVNLIDTIMIGRLGDIALSAVNLSSQFPFLYMTAVMGVANAGLIIASQAFGNNRPDRVRAMLSFCLKIAAVLNIIFFALSFFVPEFIVSIYTNDAEIIVQGGRYLKILSFSMLFQSFAQTAVIILRSAGISRLGFTSSLFACLANVFFNWVFIFGNLGAPAMGIPGAALGTVLARVTEMIVVIIGVAMDTKLGWRLSDLRDRLDAPAKADFIRIGTPSIISEVTQNLNVSAAAMITGRVSQYYIAANTIVHNIWTVSSLFMFGLSMGANVIIGNVIGSNEMEKADEYAGYFINLAALIGLAAAFLTQIIAPVITGFFNVSPQALATAAELTKAAGIAVFFLAMQMILTKGVLRGGGQAAAVTRVDLLTCWLINIPCGFIVALVLHLNPFWIYLSLRVDYLIKTVWAVWKIKKTDWKIRLNVD